MMIIDEAEAENQGGLQNISINDEATNNLFEQSTTQLQTQEVELAELVNEE